MILYYKCSFKSEASSENEQIFYNFKQHLPPEYTLTLDCESTECLVIASPYTPVTKQFTVQDRRAYKVETRLIASELINYLTGGVDYVYKVVEQYKMDFMPDAIIEHAIPMEQKDYVMYVGISGSKKSLLTETIFEAKNTTDGTIMRVIYNHYNKKLTVIYKCPSIELWTQYHNGASPIENMTARSNRKKVDIDKATDAQKFKVEQMVAYYQHRVEQRNLPADQREKPPKKRSRHSTKTAKDDTSATNNQNSSDNANGANDSVNQVLVPEGPAAAQSTDQSTGQTASKPTTSASKTTKKTADKSQQSSVLGGLYTVGSKPLKPVAHKRKTDEDEDGGDGWSNW